MAVLPLATVADMALQDFIAVAMATALGKPCPETLLAGSIALTAGKQTMIAWAPECENNFDIANTREVGITSVALGLVFHSLTGGPIARLPRSQRSIPELRTWGLSSCR